VSVELKNCVVRLSHGERVGPELAALLDPIDPASVRTVRVPRDKPTTLHFHDRDEYWCFVEGRTTVILRAPDGTTEQFRIDPVTLVIAPKGIEHAHSPDCEVLAIEWGSKPAPGARNCHLTREL